MLFRKTNALQALRTHEILKVDALQDPSRNLQHRLGTKRAQFECHSGIWSQKPCHIVSSPISTMVLQRDPVGAYG